MSSSSQLHLGLDCGTQSFKAVVIDPAAGEIVAHETVAYEDARPGYAEDKAAREAARPDERHEDPLAWLDAMETLLARLRDRGVPMSRIAGIGGSGQQHGSVYLRRGFAGIVAGMCGDETLASRAAPALSRRTAPIWTDASTGTECAEITAVTGNRIREKTGSHATERFTGPQIRKFFKTDPAGYAATARIHLVSSFLASALVGDDAPVDLGDGAGMNLLDLDSGRWDAAILDATAPELLEKLPRIAAPGDIAGRLSSYFEKYGLPAGIPVATWTGDNPASLVGMGATRPGCAVVSLGTSDTFFAALEGFRTDPEGFGHVFGNPAGGHMSLTCFRNGSQARDRIRRETGADWEFFGVDAFRLTSPGNGGRFALPRYEPEITPLAPATGLVANFDTRAASPAELVRAVVESQILAMRSHSAWIGRFDTIRVTGGGSRSPGILKTIADVFGARVETIAIPDSAALGAAMIAAHDVGGIPYENLALRFSPANETVSPDPALADVYDAQSNLFRLFEMNGLTNHPAAAITP